MQYAMRQEHVLALWMAQQTANFRVTLTTMRGQGRAAPLLLCVYPLAGRLYEDLSICFRVSRARAGACL